MGTIALSMIDQRNPLNGTGLFDKRPEDDNIVPLILLF